MVRKQGGGILGGLFRFLFMSKPKPSRPSSVGVRGLSPTFEQPRTKDEFFEIESLGFYGRGIRSTNQRWFLAYGRVDDPNALGSSSDDMTGAVILFDQESIACRLDGLCRPKAVAVCDAGLFAVNDLGPSDDFLGPRCSLQVFGVTGRRVLQYRAGAAIERPALSADGCMLAFHTLGAPQDSSRQGDGESVFLVDVEREVTIWKMNVPVVWPTAISFDDAGRMVLVHGHSNDVYRYTFDGDFLDADVVARVGRDLAQSDEFGYQLLDQAVELISKRSMSELPDDVAEEVVGLVRKALEKRLSPNTQAKSHRILGELAEAKGDLRGALAEYNEALELNPKIGLKRRVKALGSAIQ